jgi:D-inositol-3-phosphate glycosyltransferase
MTQEQERVTNPERAQDIKVALLTGGSDRPYVFGLTTCLLSSAVALDLIASDELDLPEFNSKPGMNFLNLRGSHRSSASLASKVWRILAYYSKLMRYAAQAEARIFHILWNNKFEYLDRTLLMLYYKLLRKKIVLTAHNVNADRRDGKDTFLNRLTLRIQYRLSDHIFVHTEKMKRELIEEFAVPSRRATVIPFGINNSVPTTSLTPTEAKQRLGIRENDRTILFFGRITPYKGLEYLVRAFQQVMTGENSYRLIIAGRVDRCEKYWESIEGELAEQVLKSQVLIKADFIPDNETEIYFKAADVLILPYRNIYQSGVLFLGHSFGLPVIAADVGCLKDDVLEGQTGFLFQPENSADLARTIETYFTSDLYKNLATRRQQIRNDATDRHSWDVVAKTTVNVYADLLRVPLLNSVNHKVSSASLDVKAS